LNSTILPATFSRGIDFNSSRWAKVEQFDLIPWNLKLDEMWLASLRSEKPAEVLIELQPLLNRLEADVVYEKSLNYSINAEASLSALRAPLLGTTMVSRKSKADDGSTRSGDLFFCPGTASTVDFARPFSSSDRFR